MADLPVAQNWDVEAPNEVHRMWLDIRIQEMKSRISRTKQDIEDLKKGQIVKLEANLKMLELSLEDLKTKRDSIET